MTIRPSAGTLRASAPDLSAREAREVRDLEAELRRRIEGEVRFSAGDRAIYSTDASNYRQLPIGVVIPRTTQDVIEAVAVSRDAGVPIVNRGGGTSLAGQSCNVAVMLDHSKYLNAVLHVDRDARLATVQPGTILDVLREEAEGEEPPLTFGPDPATHTHCTLGGMIGNNSCGIRSVMAEFYGPGARTSDNLREMEVLTYDGVRLRVGPTTEEELDAIARAGGRRGEIYARLRALRDRYADAIRRRFPPIPRRVSGYSLDELLPENGFNVARALAGSESTCVTILGATVHLVASPRRRAVVLLGFRDVFAAADAVPLVRASRPIGLEGFDDLLVEFNRRVGLNREELRLIPDGQGWLLVEFGGETREEARAHAEELVRSMRAVEGFVAAEVFDHREREQRLWEVRESGLAATAFVPGQRDAWPGWEDAAVPPDRLGAYLREFRALLDRHGYSAALYGHFGQGCVHCRIDFDLQTADGLARYRDFVGEGAELVAGYGGSISGEHGDGQARAELLGTMYGEELLGAFREFKAIWDPDGKMNPGKVVDPAPITANLKQGTDYAPKEVQVHFGYPEDEGSFAHAALRCVGVGKCRRLGGGTMCPSFMVTREEKHTTRGRARALFEMMNGAEIDPWKSDEVFDALELCLACKGCKGDCPVNVDMATYKAEFLSHYYEGRLRPRVAYAMGLIPWWARLASKAPRIANAATHAPVLRDVVKWAGGIAPQRAAPSFATETFREWFARRTPANPDGRRVILWPDTFTNYFTPEVGKAHVRVLEAAGCRVALPDGWLCCGRPLYDYGMLDLAKRLLADVVEALRDDIREGTPVIGMEPSCLATFRDELPSLLSGDRDAARLARQSVMLSEFLADADGWRAPRLDGTRALVHGHCHHKSVLDFETERALLDGTGLDLELPESGCCGLAGSFGFERGEKYEVSVKAGERVLLPAVRAAGDDTLLVADGFSCRTQIEHGTGRRAMHVAEVLALGLDDGEQPSTEPSRGPQRMRGLAVGAAVIAAGLGARRLARRRTRARRRR